MRSNSSISSLLLNSSTIVTIVQRISLMAADAIIVAVTVYHTYGTMKASRDANVQASFSSTLLRTGQSEITDSDRFPLTLIFIYTRHNIL